MTIGLSSSGYSSECRTWKEKTGEEQVEVESGEASQGECAMDGMEMTVTLVICPPV